MASALVPPAAERRCPRDPFLDEERLFRATLRSDAYDVVVLGMGDWPASSTVQPKGLWPLRRYRSHIDSGLAVGAVFHSATLHQCVLRAV